MNPNDTITLKLVEHGETTVTVDRAEYEQAKAAGMLDHFLDAYASDMETRTTVVEPDGTELDPFGTEPEDEDDEDNGPPLTHVYFMHDTITPQNVRATLDLAVISEGDIYELPGAGPDGTTVTWRVVRVEHHFASGNATAYCTDA